MKSIPRKFLKNVSSFYWIGLFVICALIELTPQTLFATLRGETLRQTISQLQHSDHRVRHAAAKTLGDHRTTDRNAQSALQRSLEDPHTEVRKAAAESLGKIKPSDSGIHHALKNTLAHDADPNVRVYAARALGEIKPTDPTIHRAIREASENDPNPLVRLNASHALVKILQPNATGSGASYSNSRMHTIQQQQILHQMLIPTAAPARPPLNSISHLPRNSRDLFNENGLLINHPERDPVPPYSATLPEGETRIYPMTAPPAPPNVNPPVYDERDPRH